MSEIWAKAQLSAIIIAEPLIAVFLLFIIRYILNGLH